MDKKDFKDLNKRELVDLVYTMMEGEEHDGDLPPIDDVIESREKLRYRRKFVKVLKSTAAVLVVVAAIASLISVFFLSVIQVSGDSMEPSLSNGDIVLLLKTKKYSREDLCCISWQNKLLLKRVIGMPGDIVNMDADGYVYVNGDLLDEPYVQNRCLGECDIEFPYVVPDNKLFVMGDHRDTSIDSRSTAVGCVDYDQMMGKVLFRIWSA